MPLRREDKEGENEKGLPLSTELWGGVSQGVSPQSDSDYRPNPKPADETNYLRNLVKQGEPKRQRTGGIDSQHEPLDDYLRRMNPFGDRRGPIS